MAGNLTEELQIPKDFFKSEEYTSCDGLNFKSNLAARFYRRHMITREYKDLKMSFLNLRHCIWACDDAKDPLAIDMRKLAIEAADMLIKNDDEDRNLILLMKADFLRRTCQFEQLIEEYEGIVLDDENSNMVIRYQIEKAHKKDDGCYTTEEVFGN